MFYIVGDWCIGGEPVGGLGVGGRWVGSNIVGGLMGWLSVVSGSLEDLLVVGGWLRVVGGFVIRPILTIANQIW